jgi:hypothetical protein
MAHTSDVSCPTCGAAAGMRVNRTGFMQQSVLCHFGIYPWKCGACGVTFLSRNRGEKPHRRRHGDGSESAEQQERRA